MRRNRSDGTPTGVDDVIDCGGTPSLSGRGPRRHDLVVSLSLSSSSRGGAPLDPDGNDDKDNDEDDKEDDDDRSHRGSIAPTAFAVWLIISLLQKGGGHMVQR